ncbi:MAG: glycoside hydrolase family 75 protein [Acidobacteriia bacterium]|nr:glycoside hydrolase family 75 protein [Terriglobia bacterium]
MSQPVLCSLPLVIALASFGHAQTEASYTPPPDSAGAVSRVPFAAGKRVGQRFQKRFLECDTQDRCDGKPLKAGCTKDQNRNTALLDLPNNVLFYEAKMAVDADGSPLSKNNPGKTDQADTSFRYAMAGRPSVDSDKVPYIAVPSGGFTQELGVRLGDIAAVIYRDKIVYALVADIGPACKIGEGSIQLHEQIGHPVCRSRNAQGECTKILDSGIEKSVLYIVFRGSGARILKEITPANVNDRVATEGAKLMLQLTGESAAR